MNITTFDALTEKIRSSGKDLDIEKITAAYELANSAHQGQMRKGGGPYISHPIAVASILLDINMDSDTISAALLHDVVEDTDVTLDDLRRQFGETVALLVDGVTKIRMVNLKHPDNQEGEKLIISSKEELKNEGIRKILVAMSKDFRVIILKLADRLHNMRTLESLSQEKRKKIAHESMSFYAPLAHRLGIAHFKDEMENLSLLYLDEFAYKEIENSLEHHREWREGFIQKIAGKIKDRLSDMIPQPVIESRVKGIYSLYKKMYTTGKNLDEIYDVYAFRIIVNSNSTVDCYNVLGVIHEMFTPISGRFKDYIATPKKNGYQSLHTTVLGKDKQHFEVQIRTKEMHSTARYGVAAHWQYKLGLNSKNALETKFEFLRLLLEQQQQSEDVDFLANAVKTDLSPEEVYVFTPKGDVKGLMKGSTVVDFAYSIHTDVGNKMKGAKIHGKLVNFERVLETGDVVEIQTSSAENYGPNRSWLAYAKTNEARNKISRWLKRERNDENIQSGRAYVESILRREGVLTRKNVDEIRSALNELVKSRNFNSREDFYAAIGYGGLPTEKASLWIRDAFKEKIKPRQINPEEQISQNREKLQSVGVTVEGVENCRTKFANCCNPLPGDEIIGFVTRGYGVSVHKKECDNILKRMLSDDGDRLISVSWPENSRDTYTTVIDVIADERNELLAEISATITKGLSIRIISSRSRILKNGNMIFNLTVEIVNADQLETLMAKLNKIDGVISVERTGNK
ncbi:MAG: bifunctional (p)ppGpp synthetase/guanosine-3',5'-bis(diphosphate) 3'-pyrophosphohydrolase [Oscillospiraceae bacterium]|nr:bifunctional (p)ppGpp synthetase/guanosine-3',5'-bis(diphosphate) 3'-pyrophosphohydrolase [Oscillospiraceae bacterium]